MPFFQEAGLSGRGMRARAWLAMLALLLLVAGNCALPQNRDQVIWSDQVFRRPRPLPSIYRYRCQKTLQA